MDKKERMIVKQLKGRNIHDQKVLKAMRSVDREIFVPDDLKDLAYEDSPLPIGKGQTISQPFIVAYMAQVLDIQPYERILEIGSGCGYNAAVLAQLATHIYSVEIIEWLADLARKNLKKAKIGNVSVRTGDGFSGWPENAPFDKIVLTAAAPQIPETLKNQLKTGGKILAPVTDTQQKLSLIEKPPGNKFVSRDMLQVRFVPMTGEVQNSGSTKI